MTMNRRDFLSLGTAFAAVGMSGRAAAQAAGLAMREPRLVFGAVSDLHVVPEHKLFTEHLEKAFAYFRDHGADGVVVAGDMADGGLLGQLQAVGAAWRKVFPGNRGLNGKPVEKLFVYGNHDRFGRGKGRISLDFAGSWRKAFDEDYDEIRMKEVKGYRFILNNLLEMPTTGPEADYIERHRRFLTGSKPFFYVQHYHPRGTCSAPWTWGQDNGRITRILSEFPNAVAFSGHSHTPLTDERTVWQGAFTSIGTASMRYLIPFGGRENSRVFGLKDTAGCDSQMGWMGCQDGKHGQLVTVYDDCLVIERRDFQYDGPVGADWVVPWPRNDSYSFAARAAKAAVPEFPADAKVTFTTGKGKSRKGVLTEQTTVRFPNVCAPVRAFDYEVTVECREVDVDKVLCQKRVYSEGYYRTAAKDVKTVSCVFSNDQIKYPHYVEHWSGKKDVVQATAHRRFVVRPCNCFGGKGRAIYSDWL